MYTDGQVFPIEASVSKYVKMVHTTTPIKLTLLTQFNFDLLVQN